MTRAPLARLVAAATLVVAATVVLGPTAPASAASCTSADGVTVVVDPGALGGALTSVCDGGAGQAASARYADSGVALTYAQRQPGFVCRVDGAPASDPCVNTPPADAYWGLFWTDGTDGTWTYSSIGVTGLQVPEGGAVALAWQQGTTRRTPGIVAPVHQPSPTRSPSPSKSPTPTKAPSTSPTRTPSPSPTTSSAAPSAPTSSAGSPTATPSTRPSSRPSSAAPSSSAPASPARTPKGKRSGTSSARPSATATDDATTSATTSAPASAATSDDQSDPTADAPAGEEGRVPTWVTLAVLGVLLAVTAALAVAARRRRGDQP